MGIRTIVGARMGDDGTPNFPNATLYLSQAELDFWTSAALDPRMTRSSAGVRKHILPLRDRIQIIRDEEEFLPGVHALATPGHTPGHMAFLFDGAWCLTGDVAFHDPLSYSFADAESVYDTDRNLGVRTRRRLLNRLVADRLSIVGYHHSLAWLSDEAGANWAERFGSFPKLVG